MSKIRIVGAIASKTGITLYLENGVEMNLPRDSRRTKAILDDALAALARHEIVELDLDTFSVERRIEKKTGSLIRFVREKVGKITSLFNTTALTVEEAPIAAPDPVVEEELVAYVGKTRIPGVAALEKQMDRAAYGDNIAGFQRFMERVAAVIEKRGHSVEELLNFMQRGDLPIADDGSIIAYKVLQSADNESFVDCYSGKVTQRLGSRVSMAESLVNPSRRLDCASGLHIARRGYLRHFSGDTITMVKVAPEDVIAVPSGEPDKMRAAAYHIVAVLPKEVHDVLRSNQPMTDNSIASQMLADVIAGDHMAIIENVVIGSEMGGDVIITQVGGAKPAPKPFQNGEAQALDGKQVGITVKEVRKAIDKAVAEAPVVAAETAAERRNRVKREKRAALRETPAEPVADPVAAPAPKPEKVAANANELPEKYRLALNRLAAGHSPRAVEKELHICRKTLRRLAKG